MRYRSVRISGKVAAVVTTVACLCLNIPQQTFSAEIKRYENSTLIVELEESPEVSFGIGIYISVPRGDGLSICKIVDEPFARPQCGKFLYPPLVAKLH